VTGFLLDTNVVSELIKPRPNSGVVRWMEATDEPLLHLSVLTLGEIRKGITSVPDTKRRIALETWLNRDLVLRFEGRIFSIDQAVADRWGKICGGSTHPLPVIDSLLAATALYHELTLVTRDTRPVEATGVALLNPWIASTP
jgi:toxin FitB